MDLEPFIDDIVHFSELLAPVLHRFDEELDIFALTLHAHEFHGVLVELLHHKIQRHKDLSVIVVFKLELELVPSDFDILQLLLDLSFLLSHVNQFVDLGFEQVKLEVQHILEAEILIRLVKVLFGEFLELLPVALLHKL